MRGVTEGRGEPIKNPITGAEHRVRIDIPDGFEYSLAEMGRGWTTVSQPMAIKLADSYAQFAHVNLCQNGIVRMNAHERAALEAVLRRDRAVVIAALALITALAWADLVWLADDMAMGGMDMTGFRMIPAGRGLMMPARRAMAADRVRLCVRHVGRDDDRHDDAFGRADDSHLRPRRAAGSESQGKPFAASAWFAAGYLLAWTAFSLASRPRRNGRSSAPRCSRR